MGEFWISSGEFGRARWRRGKPRSVGVGGKCPKRPNSREWYGYAGQRRAGVFSVVRLFGKRRSSETNPRSRLAPATTSTQALCPWTTVPQPRQNESPSAGPRNCIDTSNDDDDDLPRPIACSHSRARDTRHRQPHGRGFPARDRRRAAPNRTSLCCSRMPERRRTERQQARRPARKTCASRPPLGAAHAGGSGCRRTHGQRQARPCP